MTVVTHTHEISSKGQGDTIDVTEAVASAITRTNLHQGIVTVFVVGSTAGMTTIEFESGVVHDVDAALERIAPRGAAYRHHLRWRDDNGSSHVRAALVGPSVTIPFTNGRLRLGEWQQIVVCEFDTRARRREVVLQFIGE
jgi:secondary thiamine-phosphate synthase enzyme